MEGYDHNYQLNSHFTLGSSLKFLLWRPFSRRIQCHSFHVKVSMLTLKRPDNTTLVCCKQESSCCAYFIFSQCHHSVALMELMIHAAEFNSTPGSCEAEDFIIVSLYLFETQSGRTSANPHPTGPNSQFKEWQ